MSKDRIVNAAIELLDKGGENGLTFRALAESLGTGSGAIYWHVSGKEELLSLATDVIVKRALDGATNRENPRSAIHQLALCIFRMIDTHPWVGEQLNQSPPTDTMLGIFERIGQQVMKLSAAGISHFTAASVLGSFIISESRQNASFSQLKDQYPDRTAHLETVANQWRQLDAEEFPFLQSIADQLSQHDDELEYLGGVDLIIAGIESPR